MAGSLGADPPELLDVDVDQLAGPLLLIAPGRLEPEPAQAPESDPGEDPRDGGLGDLQQLADLGAGEAQAPQGADRLDPVLRGPVPDPMGGRGAVEQAELAFG